MNPIGIFDSGVGGLTVLKEIRDLLPREKIIYFADQKNVPYGGRSAEEITRFSIEITDYFISKDVKMIVIACNTASAAALDELRNHYPKIPFVGVEPAVKPASEKTESGKVGVLATPGTIQSDKYAGLVKSYAENIEVYENTCDGLVQEIENRNFEGKAVEDILNNAITPMLEANVDALVLGCTHYPFVMHKIKEITKNSITIINPAPAIARQVERLLDKYSIMNVEDIEGNTEYITSGDLEKFEKFLFALGFEGKTEKYIG